MTPTAQAIIEAAVEWERCTEDKGRGVGLAMAALLKAVRAYNAARKAEAESEKGQVRE